MPSKTGRRKQTVATGLGTPVEHDGIPHMMSPASQGGGDTSPMVPGVMPHPPHGGPMGMSGGPGGPPCSGPAGFFPSPNGPGVPNGPNGPQMPGMIPGQGPGPGMPMHGPGPGGPHGPMNAGFFR